jgi:hypothetical protein
VQRFRDVFSNRAYTHILIHSVTPPLLEAIAIPFKTGMSYLLKSDGNRGWKTVRT